MVEECGRACIAPVMQAVSINAANILHTSPTSTTTQSILADSATSRTILRASDVPPVPPPNDIVRLRTIAGSITCPVTHSPFPIPGLPGASLDALICPDSLLHTSLVSLAEVCDRGVEVSLTATGIRLIKNGIVFASADKAPTDRMWSFPTPSPVDANYVMHHQVNAEMVAFYHAACGSPSISSFIRAVAKGFLASIPQLTVARIRANPPMALATARGHMQAMRQGVRSTSLTDTWSADLFSTADTSDDVTSAVPCNICYVYTFATMEMRAYSDATGRLPVPSCQGSEYILVSVLEGYIHAVPMKSRTATCYMNAFKETFTFWHARGRFPTIQHLDNEVSRPVIDLIKNEYKIQLDRAPPNDHRANVAERAIQTYKSAWLSLMFTADPLCPLHLWEYALPQLEIVVNVLRPCPVNPSISAYHALWGSPYDFAAHPLAPFGTRVEVHVPTHATWAAHSVPGWYVGPAPDAYRQFMVYTPATQTTRVSNALSWYSLYRIPGSSPYELLLAAIQDFTTVLAQVPARLEPMVQPSFTTAAQPLVDQLRAIADVFQPTGPFAATLLVPGGVPTGVAVLPPQMSPGLQLLVPSQPAPAPMTQVAEIIIPKPPVPVETATPSPPIAPPIATLLNKARPRGPQPQRSRKPTAARPPSTVPSIPLVAAPAKPRYGTRAASKASFAHTNPFNALAIDEDDVTDDAPGIPLPSQAHTRCQPDKWIAAACKAKSSTPQGPPPGPPAPNMSAPSEEFDFAAFAHVADPTAPKFNAACRGPQASIWLHEADQELIRLVEVTKTMHPLPFADVPANTQVMTYNQQCKLKHPGTPQEKYRVRGTAGGNLSTYDGDVSAYTATLVQAKILLNHVLSTPGATFSTIDLVDFYLIGTTLDTPEYLRIPRSHISTTIEKRLHLERLWHKGYIYFQITGGMYGLPQAGRIAQQNLFPRLRAAGFSHSTDSPCVFKHSHLPIAFSLTVDDFGCSHVGDAPFQHLIDALSPHYQCKVDRQATKFLGMHLAFDYQARTCQLSLPGYIDRGMSRFDLQPPERPTFSPAAYATPLFGVRSQQVPDAPVSPPLLPKAINLFQQEIGYLKYYAMLIDSSALCTLSKLGADQANPTQHSLTQLRHLWAYFATLPDATLQFQASNMQLTLHSDASYNSEPLARSRAGGHWWLGTDTPGNAAIHAVSKRIDVVVSSASEAEYGAAFINAQACISLVPVLEFLGWHQKPVPIIMDNQIAHGMATGKFTPKKSKSMDMRFHWLKDRVLQGQFELLWEPGADNLADIHTKILPLAEYRRRRTWYLCN